MKKPKFVRTQQAVAARQKHPVAAIAKAVAEAAAPRPEASSRSHAPEPLRSGLRPIEFKMRVECENDGELLYEVLQPYVTHWKEKRGTIHHNGKEYPDIWVEVEFGIRAATLTLDDIRSVFRCMTDCHVAEETVALTRDYTGERVPLEEVGTVLGAPARELLEPMRARMDAVQEFLRVQSRRAERASAVLKKIAETGALPELDKAGTIALVNHAPTGLTSVRRISGWATGSEDPVRDRMLLLQQ